MMIIGLSFRHPVGFISIFRSQNANNCYIRVISAFLWKATNAYVQQCGCEQ